MQLKQLTRNYASVLHATPWLHVFGYAALMLFFGKLLGLALPPGMRHPFNHLLQLSAIVMVIAKDLAGAPQFLQRVRAVSAKGTGWSERIAALFPPGFIALLRLDRALLRGFYCWLARRSPAPRPDGVKLTYLERGAYSTAIAIALFSIFVDVPINMFIVSVIPIEPGQRTAIHLLFAFASAYSLMWVIGDRWLVGTGCHILTPTELDLQVGARTVGRIPLSAIAACEPVTEKRADWCRRKGIPTHSTLLVSPFDQPNLVLSIKPASGIALSHYQMQEKDLSYVFLYVDRPELLVAALARPTGE